jgi:hypothetical protein
VNIKCRERNLHADQVEEKGDNRVSVIKEEYQDLPPLGEKLADVVVLAQAWKKSHTYIRRHNWYADVLELDVSTIDLEERLGQWAWNVSQENFRPDELLLVPAPKNARWAFSPTPTFTPIADLFKLDHNSLGSEPTFDDWTPEAPTPSGASTSDEANEAPAQKLRPLAHLSIRDQTLSTVVMMCLAEAVETAQGDTTGPDVLAMRANGVVSYGNRLQCTWDAKVGATPCAKFSWGNSGTYRQYFQDYRTFLARPRRICAELMPQLAPRRELFVVSLDIKSFFDKVDRRALLNELRWLESEHRTTHGVPARLTANELFWLRAARVFAWKSALVRELNQPIHSGRCSENTQPSQPMDW